MSDDYHVQHDTGAGLESRQSDRGIVSTDRQENTALHFSTRFTLICGLFSAFLLFQASLEQDQGLTVREAWQLRGVGEEEPFVSVSGMAEAADGAVWVSSSKLRSVYRISGEGEPLGIVATSGGGAGEGPGEVNTPTLLARQGEDVLVFDLMRSSIEIFDRAGSFKRRVLLERRFYNPKGLSPWPDGGFAVSGGTMSGDFAVHRFDENGEHQQGWFSLPHGPDDDPRLFENAQYTAGGPISVTDDGILYSRSAPHLIAAVSSDEIAILAQDHDLLGDPVANFQRVEIENGRRVNVYDWFYPQSRGVFALADDRILNIVTFEEERKSLWELYGFDGELERRVWVEKPYWPWDLTADGAVLASYRDAELGEARAVRLEIDW